MAENTPLDDSTLAPSVMEKLKRPSPAPVQPYKPPGVRPNSTVGEALSDSGRAIADLAARGVDFAIRSPGAIFRGINDIFNPLSAPGGGRMWTGRLGMDGAANNQAYRPEDPNNNFVARREAAAKAAAAPPTPQAAPGPTSRPSVGSQAPPPSPPTAAEAAKATSPPPSPLAPVPQSPMPPQNPLPELVQPKVEDISQGQKDIWTREQQALDASKPVAPEQTLSPVQKREAEEAKNKSLAAQTVGMQTTRTYTAIDKDGKPQQVAETGKMAGWSDGMRSLIKNAKVEGDDLWALGEVDNPAQYFDPNTGAFDKKRMNADLLEQRVTKLELQKSTPEGRAELQNEYFRSPEGRAALGDYNTAVNKFRSKYGGINPGGAAAEEEAGKRLAAGLGAYLSGIDKQIDDLAKNKKQAADIEAKLQEAWQRGDEAAKKLYADQLDRWHARNSDLVKSMSQAYTERNKDMNAANRTNAASANERTLGMWQARERRGLEEWKDKQESARFAETQRTLRQGQEYNYDVGKRNAAAAQTAAENKGADGSGRTTEAERAAKSRTDFVADYIKNKQASGLPLNRDQLLAAETEATEMWDRLNGGGAKATVGGAERRTTPKGEIIEKQADGSWLVVGTAGGK